MLMGSHSRLDEVLKEMLDGTWELRRPVDIPEGDLLWIQKDAIRRDIRNCHQVAQLAITKPLKHHSKMPSSNPMNPGCA